MWLSTNSTMLHFTAAAVAAGTMRSVFIHIPLFASAESFSEQRQMEGVIQNDQTPETHKTEATKGYRIQEAPWRPQSRTECVDELMHSNLQRPEEVEGKPSI